MMDAFLPHMHGGGRVVVLSSGTSWQVKFDNQALYDRAFSPTLSREELDQMAKEFIVRITPGSCLAVLICSGFDQVSSTGRDGLAQDRLQTDVRDEQSVPQSPGGRRSEKASRRSRQRGLSRNVSPAKRRSSSSHSVDTGVPNGLPFKLKTPGKSDLFSIDVC